MNGRSTHNSSQLKIPVRLGILGGGQLARMIAVACQGMGVEPHILGDKTSDCAREVTSHFTVFDGSAEVLEVFCKSVDVLTIENEFLNLERLEKCLGRTPIFPTIASLRKVQSKLDQKRNLHFFKIPTLPFVEIVNGKFDERSLAHLGQKLVIKQARNGYDGKGTFVIEAGELNVFLESQAHFEGYAEPFASFKMEISVVVVRSRTGDIQCFPVTQSHQSHGVCHWTLTPAAASKGILEKAIKIAKKTIKSFDGVGAFGIEMFVLRNGSVVINEIAPRVHNTGHYTMNGCQVSQFEQHVRAVLGIPILKPKLLSPSVAMVNILGSVKRNLSAGERISTGGNIDSETWIHWYGKSGAAQGRKLGHVNATGKSGRAVLKKAQKVRDLLDI